MLPVSNTTTTSINSANHKYGSIPDSGEQIVVSKPDDEWTNLLYPQNVALAASYFIVGFVPSFVSTPLMVYLVEEIDAHPAIQNTIGVTLSLPWAFKLAMGFCSDAFPIGGERRRPYIFIGYVLCCTAYLCLAWIGTPSAPVLGLLLALATTGMVMADTICDSMIVARSREEDDEDHGHLQSSCYAFRFCGSVIAAIGGALLYNKSQWGWGLTFSQVMVWSGILPLVLMLPLLPFLKEMRSKDEPVLPVLKQLENIWSLVKLKAVWMPMTFIFIYNVFQVSNVAWSSYLQLSLHFSPYILGTLRIAGTIMTFVGILAYKAWFIRSSWRSIYIVSTLLTTIFSLFQLLLVFQINTKYLHVPNAIFALGDDVVSAFLNGLQFLPVCIQYLRLCPEGSEGLSFAMLTTMGNIGLLVGNSIGSLLSGIWDVSNKAMRHHDISGLWKLTLLTSSLSPLPLILLNLLPANPDEQKKLQEKSYSSPLAGMTFIITLLSALSWVVFQAVALLIKNERG